MSGTLRRKKGKTRLVSFFHQVKKENPLKSIKAVKELELTDRKISKSLLSSKCTCMLFSQWECSHLQAVIQAVIRPFCLKCYCQECVWQICTALVTFSIVCSSQGLFIVT